MSFDKQATFSCFGSMNVGENFLDLLSKKGISLLKELRGEFSIFVKDPLDSKYYLVRDKLGVIPLYYAIKDNAFYYSQSLKDFISVFGFKFIPNSEGLADFLLPGRNSNPDLKLTCFEGIYSVRPGHYIEISKSGIHEVEYWDFDTTISINYKNYEEYVDHFRELYIQAVKRRLSFNGTTAVSLSGGLDSSTLFSVANTHKSKHQKITAVSYTSDIYGDCDEKYFIKLLSEKYASASIHQYRIEDQDGFFSGVNDQIEIVEEPFVDFLWPVTKKIYQIAKNEGADILLTGHWGDQLLFSQEYLLDFFRKHQWKMIYHHLSEYKKWCSKEEYKFYRNYFLREAIKMKLPNSIVDFIKKTKKILNKKNQDEVLSPLLQFSNSDSKSDRQFHSLHAKGIYQIVKSKYHVRCMEWNFKVAQSFNMRVSFPMLDEDLVQFLISIPGDVISSDGISRNILRQAFRDILPEPISNRTWKADFTEVVNSKVEADWLKISEILSDDPIAVKMNLVNAIELKKRLHWKRNSDCLFSWEIVDYLGLEMWLKKFGGIIDGKSKSNKEEIFEAHN